MSPYFRRLGVFISVFAFSACLHAQTPVYVWVEGENADKESEVKRHPWWYDQVNKEAFSGGDFISNWSGEEPAHVQYTFQAPKAGNYNLWLRANASQSSMTLNVNEGEVQEVPMNRARERVNVAGDGKNDLRYLSWIPVGSFDLKAGDNEITLAFTSENNRHGYLDAFTFVQGPFSPFGTAKPDEAAEQMATADGPDWKAWNPVRDPHEESPIDLRILNETEAGAHGRIQVKDGEFVREADGQVVRFWAINGPGGDETGEDLQHTMRQLAKRGVNLIRIHGAVFDRKTGELLPGKVDQLQEITARAKKEGIYTHYSIYFPLWFYPNADLEFLKGYDSESKSYAALFFNPAFEAHYQGWWKSILQAPNPHGPKLVEEPALMSVELINEDSFFFWTFTDQNIPEPQLKILEEMFYEWVLKEYGTLERAYVFWEGMKLNGDRPEEKRLDFRPLWNMFQEKSPRDQDTAEFLATVQRRFYERQVEFLKGSGFKGLITASNWHTADDQTFKPLEIWTYLPGDFIDRHGYFGTFAEGENVNWSMRARHLYADRSALKFDPRIPGEAMDFSHPVADPKYNSLPSMISETTWTRPNRYRTEAPLFYAAYASLQGSNSIVHFAHDGSRWEVKPRFWMQPWTLMSPSQMGQFPATALIYRNGYIDEGEMLATIGLKLEDLFELKGTPLVQKGNLDELRLADVSGGTAVTQGEVVDPRIHFMGRTEVVIGEEVPETKVENLTSYLDENAKIIRGSNGQIELDYGKGVLKVNAPKAQALSGNLKAAGETVLDVLTVHSALELGHVILVTLDDQSLQTSGKMLLQVMSEERNSGWRQQWVGNQGKYRVQDIGKDPWRFKALEGEIRLNRPDAAGLKITSLDLNGYPLEEVGTADGFQLREDTVYYLIEK